MKTLITGAGGFIGSHLVEECVARGDKVRAFVHYNSRNDWGWLDALACKSDVEVVTGDIRDFDSVYRATDGMDCVLHLAALIGIPYSYTSPLAYISTNVTGTYNILESSRLHGVGQVLSTSTSETYGSAQYVPMDEKHPTVAQSPYSATKISADKMCESYHLSFDMPVKIVRPFNTYGPRQSARAIIPTVALQLLAGATEIRVGNLSPTRDFNYVKDTVRGFLAIRAADELAGEVVNIGTGTEISVEDTITKLAEIVGCDVRVTQESERIRPSASEVTRLCADNTRITEATHWKPQFSLDEGLAETVAFLREHQARYKSDLYNV